MVTCKSCSMVLTDNESSAPSVRQVCPNCHSDNRRFLINLDTAVFVATSTSTEPTAQITIVAGQKLPRFGEILLYVFLTRSERINVIGDLSEDYQEATIKFGRRCAVRCFYAQVFRSLWPLLRRWLFRASVA